MVDDLSSTVLSAIIIHSDLKSEIEESGFPVSIFIFFDSVFPILFFGNAPICKIAFDSSK
jgi:hypothetical protein